MEKVYGGHIGIVENRMETTIYYVVAIFMIVVQSDAESCSNHLYVPA